MTSDKNRANDLKRRFNLTPEEYDAMLAEQNYGCALCGSPGGVRRLHVDHDHATGKVRGLLCLPCNGALHYLERASWMEDALIYLQRGHAD